MLISLTVSNFALAKSLEIEFGPGLTVITGESGAGKTVLLQALSLILGSRIRREQISVGVDECEVTAEFDIAQVSSVQTFLNNHELRDELAPNRCVIRRTANTSGRSRAWLNGTPCTLAILQNLCRPLFGIHGQFEQHELLEPNTQLTWYDDFGSDPELLQKVADQYQHWRNLEKAYEQEQATVGLTLQHKELLEYQVAELRELDLGATDVHDLNLEFKRSSRSHELKQIVNDSIEHLDNVIRPTLLKLTQSLESTEDEHTALVETIELLKLVNVHLDEIGNQLGIYNDSLEIDPQRLSSIDHRLTQIHDVARKHRVTVNGLFEHVRKLTVKLDQLEDSEARFVQMQTKIQAAEQEFRTSAKLLSQQRKSAKDEFCLTVMKMLAEVKLPDVRFDVAVEPTINSRGLDKVEYLVSTNKDYNPMPLGRIASGGEVSRIALAILIVVAKRSRLPSLILDEADVGVGGTTAAVVGRMLRTVAKHNQVVCVTHAPQVAATGDSHLLVTKEPDSGIKVIPIEKEQRIEEIARMVGGQQVNEQSRQYASSLLAEVTQ